MSNPAVELAPFGRCAVCDEAAQRRSPLRKRSSMVNPWLAVGKFALENINTIIEVVTPVFTRKMVEALPSQTDLLNQQISELQAAASRNADQVKQLAEQLKEVVAGLNQAALNAAIEREKVQKWCFVSLAILIVSIIAAIAAFIVRCPPSWQS